MVRVLAGPWRDVVPDGRAISTTIAERMDERGRKCQNGEIARMKHAKSMQIIMNTISGPVRICAARNTRETRPRLHSPPDPCFAVSHTDSARRSSFFRGETNRLVRPPAVFRRQTSANTGKHRCVFFGQPLLLAYLLARAN